jgi:hypothetical protein
MCVWSLHNTFAILLTNSLAPFGWTACRAILSFLQRFGSNHSRTSGKAAKALISEAPAPVGEGGRCTVTGIAFFPPPAARFRRTVRRVGSPFPLNGTYQDRSIAVAVAVEVAVVQGGR